MKKTVLILLVITLLTNVSVHAQHGFINPELQKFAREALINGIDGFDNVNQACAVVMDTSTGKVIADVCVRPYDNTYLDIPNGNAMAMPSAIGRAVIYLGLMGEGVSPESSWDCGEGIYTDSISGCTITDHLAYRHGGYGEISLKNSLNVSDIGIYKAVEHTFGRDMGRYASAIRKTGILFEDCNDSEDDYGGYYGIWNPCDILGYSSKFSHYQQAAWVNMVANGGKLLLRVSESESKQALCVVKNEAGLDSLRSAMLDIVENGTGTSLRSVYTLSAGFVNATPPDGENNRLCFAAAFFPYDHPLYTVSVFVSKKRPASRGIPLKTTKDIIEYIAKNYILEYGAAEKDLKIHPAEKGVDTY